MAVRANPTVIGAFVLGGLVLFIVALVLFGSLDIFKDKTRWVTYFDGSVEGLTVGAPVNFRGVRIGSVTAVKLVVDVRKLQARIPVYMEIDRNLITWAGGVDKRLRPEQVVAAGMRAKLAMQSLVTGQMTIDLDLLPNTPAKLVGADTSVPEVPSIPSDVAVIKERLEKLPIEAVVTHIDTLAQSVNRLVTSPQVDQSLKSLNDTLVEMEQLISQLGETVIPLVRQATISLRDLSTDGRATLGEYRKLAGTGTAAVGDLRTSLRTADQTLQQARATLSSINSLVANDTTSRADIEAVLDNLNRTSESLRSFADTLERNPNALLLGR